MMNRLRALVFVTLGFLLMSLCPASVFAADGAESVPYKQYRVIILDKADLLTAEEEKQLAEEMKDLAFYGNMIFVTVKLKNSQYEKFAEDTYYKLCGNEPGALFQIDMGNRKLTLSTSTGLDERLRSERDTIVDNIYTLATRKQYYACASECFREIRAVLHNQNIAHDMRYITNGILALILALLLNFIAVFLTTRKKVSKEELFGKMSSIGEVSILDIAEGNRTKTYSPRSKGSSGGGGRSGGGGGGFSGGSSSHGF
ncbi:MAG: TPM domain-containing protein [Selenomonadaceae bacterium]|nr:TPM domain-containing protein [Selenomonadaceae bacterium]